MMNIIPFYKDMYKIAKVVQIFKTCAHRQNSMDSKVIKDNVRQAISD